jgi:lipopolysaccharide export system protein LptA
VTRAIPALLLAALVTGAAPALAEQPPSPPAKPAAPAAKPAAKPAEDKNQPVTVDADHMESFQKESLVIFTGNVVARQNGSVQYADRMEVYLDEAGNRVIRTISTGNVRIITRDCRTGTAKRSEYYDGEQRVELIGNARVWQSDNVVTGERITIFLNQERSVVQGGKQERVKAIFYQKEESPAGAPAKAPPECKN